MSIQCQAGLVQPLNAALLADRYLLLDLVDGSSLYKCIDVQSQESLVCKVSGLHKTNVCVCVVTMRDRDTMAIACACV